ncbi:MAG: metallophosphoesterase [Magnetospirillum sp.]|nr:metallophosphoesterase [Magnetospirillum sp.]
MRIVAHLSDLHFGRTDPAVVEALLADLDRHRPDLVIVSGDLTQRARTRQFAEARRFLDRLAAPALAVPGNHDLAPLYRPLARLFRPRARFRRNLPGHDPRPVWSDGEVVAVGLDSTRHLRWISGKLRTSHLDHVEAVLAGAPPAACRIAFLHHPPATAPAGHGFGALAERGIDLILAGHVHRSGTDIVRGRDGAAAVLVQSATACSTRLRDEANAYGLIRIAMPTIEVTVQGWTGETFHPRHTRRFEKTGKGWREVA